MIDTRSDSTPIRVAELGPCLRCGGPVLASPVFYRLTFECCAADRAAIAQLVGTGQILSGGVRDRLPHALGIAAALTSDVVARAVIQGQALLCSGCLTNPETTVPEVFDAIGQADRNAATQPRTGT